MLVKICGIQNPEDARFAAENGADFIGMVLSPGLKRSVTTAIAQEIVAAARQAGAEPVALFVSASRAEIETTADLLNISFIQAYGLQENLSERFSRFYINETSPVRETDFILLESDTPGSGKQAVIETIPQERWFLAGGLTPANVQGFIKQYRPSGVDVSSGVEKDGKKDRELILQFIEQGKNI